MKAAWGFAFFLLFLAGIAIVNLRNVADEVTANVRPMDAADLAGSAWRLRAMPGTAISPDATIELAFEAGGGLQLRGACNRYSGNWSVAGDNAAFGPLAGTRRACEADIMRADEAMLDVLSRAQALRGTGRGLLMYDGDDKLIATMRRVAANDGGNQ